MVGNSLIHISTYPTLFPSNFATTSSTRNAPTKILPRLPTKPKLKNKALTVRAASANNEPYQQSTNPLSVVLEIPRTIWRQTLRPMNDFGFGRRSIWEGGVGIFIVSGTVLLALSLVWLKGFQLRSRFKKYVAVFEFAQACGICTGTLVRIRGVTVGNVVRVNPSLSNIEAVVEVKFIGNLFS